MSASTADVALTDDATSVISSVLPDSEVDDRDATTKLAPSDSPEPDHSNGSVVETAPMSYCSVENEATLDKADEPEVITDSVVEMPEASPDKTDKEEIVPDSEVEKTEASPDGAVQTDAAPDDSSKVPASAEDNNKGLKRPIDPEDAKANVLAKVARTDASLGSVVAGHYNNLEEKGLAARNESRILHMRNFNNWIKSFLINKHMEEVRNGMASGDQRVSVIDLGCGKGGDLLKWSKANIRHLVCVDIAETSVNQCKERFDFNKSKKYGAPRFSAEFIVADCTKVCFQPLLKDPTLKVQMVSCQFAFHYCFESLSQAETMIKNASANLAKGGYFILTIPDANYIT